MMDKAELEQLLSCLSKAGWTIEMHSPPLKTVPAALARYSAVPDYVRFFVSNVATCVNAADNAWFLTDSDYNGSPDDATSFSWNAWELLSLEALADDPDICAKIRDFWDRHLPIASAVHSEYAYLAVRLRDGVVVYGHAPEFEEPETVSPSFSDYLGKLADYLSGSTSRDKINRAYRDFM